MTVRTPLSLAVALALLVVVPAYAQQSDLTVAKIMQRPESYLGGLPSGLEWSESGDKLYFRWNPGGVFPADSLFAVSKAGGVPVKVSPDERRSPRATFSGWNHDSRIYDPSFKTKVFADGGDLFLYDVPAKTTRRLTRTNDFESNPQFEASGKSITFMRSGNFYRLVLATGFTEQLTDFRSGNEARDPKLDEQDSFLRQQQLDLFDYVREQADEKVARDAARERDDAAAGNPPTFRYGNKQIRSQQIDVNARFASFVLSERSSNDGKSTKAVRQVTESGYPEEETWRSKVGTDATTPELWIQDLKNDKSYEVDLSVLPGIYDVPQYRLEQGVKVDSTKERVLESPRLSFSPDGRHAVIDVNARDNKDRWLASLDLETGTVTSLDRQHDEAWIGGPGMYTTGWIPGTNTFYFQSEKTGYSHLYTVDVTSGQIRQLTDGQFEVFQPQLSKDAKSWTFSSSEVSPFVRHFYRMPVGGGKRTQLTSKLGNNGVELNPDEKTIASLFSYTNVPPEVYIGNKRITESPREEWLAYDWRAPDIVQIPASDGVDVPAQLFIPENPNGAAVIFVHGAGYLQNVHNWWSSYFREYMFNNMLTDLGYYVVNMDYRGSAGYGRDWRTAIYRHMGGRDLQDHVDASTYLNRQFAIDPERVAIYGGSYGGFITLMALFTEPEHFGAGAALRSVTDWAHYNHGYTANILNTPVEDSLAYARSSPINFAEGLEDPLLMPHGMLDNNVHFQDIIRLTQKLIELGKTDWELAVYPVERHGFTEPASWTDEYRRILELIESEVGPDSR